MVKFSRKGYSVKFSQYILFFAFSITFLWPSASFADTDADQRNKVTNEVVNAWEKNDFKTLEQLENKYINPSETTTSGKRLLAIYDRALRGVISIRPVELSRRINLIPNTQYQKTNEEMNGPDLPNYPEVNKKWSDIENKLKKWKEQYPTSPNPIIAQSHYYINKAWYFRGKRWAKYVHEYAWPIYYENLNLAKNLLNSTKNISQNNPIWYDQMISILGAESASRGEIEAIIADTLKKGQGYPMPLYGALHFMQPRWGGSYEAMKKFAVQANQETYKEEHGEIYARLYWNFIADSPDEINSTFFQRTGADWSLLDKSFKIMIRDHPAPRNYSGYALFSCMANDIKKSKALLIKAGTKIYAEQWPEYLKIRCVPKGL